MEATSSSALETSRASGTPKRWVWDLYPLAKNSWGAWELEDDEQRKDHRVYMRRRKEVWGLGPPLGNDLISAFMERGAKPDDFAVREGYVANPDDVELLQRLYPDADPYRPAWYSIKADLSAAGHDADCLDKSEAPVLLALLRPLRGSAAAKPETGEQPSITVEEADAVAHKIAETVPTFTSGKAEQWAGAISARAGKPCSATTVKRTRFWEETMKETGRARGKGPSAGDPMRLSGEVEATTPDIRQSDPSEEAAAREESQRAQDALRHEELSVAAEAVNRCGMTAEQKEAVLEKLARGEMAPENVKETASLFPPVRTAARLSPRTKLD